MNVPEICNEEFTQQKATNKTNTNQYGVVPGSITSGAP